MFKLAKGVMPCLLLLCSAALVACNPPPKEATMSNSGPVPETAANESRERKTEGHAPASRADSPAEAEGRRTLSAAFVRLGAGENLMVELRDGSAVVLRDVVMRPRDFCGVQVGGSSAGKRYCGGYGDVAAARPGGASAPDGLKPATLNPVELRRERS